MLLLNNSRLFHRSNRFFTALHILPAGALSQTPFLQSSVPAGQAGPEMTSPLENLYPEAGPEPVFAQPGPVSTVETSSGPLQFPARDVMPPDQIEEGEVSEPEPDDQQYPDSADKHRASEDQNYRETVRGVRAFMGWTHIPDLEYSPTSRADNPWIGHHS